MNDNSASETLPEKAASDDASNESTAATVVAVEPDSVNNASSTDAKPLDAVLKESFSSNTPADPLGVEAPLDVELKDPASATPPTGQQPSAEPPPDGGLRAWSVVASSFFMQAFTFGFVTSFAPYQRYFLSNQTFGPTSNVQLAFISSISSAFTFALGPLVGRFVEIFGFRMTAFCGAITFCAALELSSLATQVWHLYLTFGVMGGTGIAFSYIPATAVVPQWFSKKMGLAMGISVAGGGIGGFIINPLAAYLLENLGWQWSYRISGFIAGAVGLCAAMVIKARIPPTKRKAGILAMFDFHRFKDFTFTRIYIMCFISGLGFFTVWPFLSSYGGSIGINPSSAALIVGLGNGMSAVGRIVMGLSSDYAGAMNIWLGNFLAAALSVLVIWTFAKTFGVLLLFALIFGMTGGSYTSLYALNVARIYGAAGQASLLGLLYTALLLPSLLGPVIGGAILDSSAATQPDGSKVYNYLGLQLYSGFTQLAGALLLCWVRLEYGAKKSGKGVLGGIVFKI